MSYHGTPVVVIEIPQGTPRPAAGDSLNLQTATGQRRDINSLLFLPLPFDLYDFFGYIVSGLVLVVLAQLIFGLPIACRPVSARVGRAKLFCIRSRLAAAPKSSGRLAIKVTIDRSKAAIPSRNVDKDSSRRILREVTPVDLVNSRKHIY
jgi:hypothetical protein